MKTCVFFECPELLGRRNTTGYCRHHIGEVLRLNKKCSLEGCNRRHHSKGLCASHYFAARRGTPLSNVRQKTHNSGEVCQQEDCDLISAVRGYCQFHYKKMLEETSESYRLSLITGAERYRTQKRNAFIQNIDRVLIYEVFNGCCYLCGDEVGFFDFELEHIVPISNGGQHSYHNVAVSCMSCNRRKNSRRLCDLEGMIRHE